MLKTFLASPLVGGLAAILGWLGALFFQDSLSEPSFADLRFGWTGSMVGATAIAVLLLIWFFTEKSVEPLVTAVCAAIGAAMLWDERELPFSTASFDRASDNFWLTVTMMGLVLILLLVGLRAARESINRAR